MAKAKQPPPAQITISAFNNAAWYIKTHGGDRKIYEQVSRSIDTLRVSESDVASVRGYFERQEPIEIVTKVTLNQFYAAAQALQVGTEYFDDPGFFNITVEPAKGRPQPTQDVVEAVRTYLKGEGPLVIKPQESKMGAIDIFKMDVKKIPRALTGAFEKALLRYKDNKTFISNEAANVTVIEIAKGIATINSFSTPATNDMVIIRPT